jgi:hypothetical protein
LWYIWSDPTTVLEHSTIGLIMTIIVTVFGAVGGLYGAVVVAGGMVIPMLFVGVAVLVFSGASIGASRVGQSLREYGAAPPAVSEKREALPLFGAFGAWFGVWFVWLGFTIIFKLVVQYSSISGDTQDAFKTATYIGLSVLSAGSLIGLAVAMSGQRARLQRPDSRTLIMIGVGLGFTSGMVCFGAA